MILFSHPTGNANVRNAALGLSRAGLLREFWTCIDYRPGRWSERLLPAGFRQQLARRAFATELQPFLHSHPIREYGRLACGRIGLGRLARHEHGCLSVDAVYRSLDRRVARRLAQRPFQAAYAYEDGACHTFRAARDCGMATLYDLPIGYWRAARDILLEEAERQPGWASTLIGNHDSRQKTERKDEELALADIVYVASSYTLKTLAAAPGFHGQVEVIPYGAPRPATVPPEQAERDSAKPLRALFVGSLGQRKGLSYLFDACKTLGRGLELTVIGTLPLARCEMLERELRAVRWIPSCPHSEVLREMANHDVFVFPSLFEGFGLVLLEAMAMGLPILTTPHTAGPDLIEEGQEGFIVPIRSAEAIAEKLDFLHSHPDAAREMGRRAALRASTFTWESYGEKLAASAAKACQKAKKKV